MVKIAFASDFDNTLHFRHDGIGYISDRDRIAITRFRRNGHLFGICTGRPLIGLRNETIDNIDLDFEIVSTGSLICESDQNATVLYEKTIDVNTIINMHTNYHEQVDIYVHADGNVYVFEEHPFAYPEQIQLDSYNELVGKHITGVSGHTNHEDISNAIVQQLNETYSDISAYQNQNWLDVVPHGISKGTAVLELKKIKNVDMVAAIGDARNDIPSLQSADISFTFPTSPDDVKACATYVVESVAEAITILEKLSEK